MPESKTQSNLLFYCTLVLTHLYRDTLGLIQGALREEALEASKALKGGFKGLKGFKASRASRRAGRGVLRA